MPWFSVLKVVVAKAEAQRLIERQRVIDVQRCR